MGEGECRPGGWCWSCLKGLFPISTTGFHTWAVKRKEQHLEMDKSTWDKISSKELRYNTLLLENFYLLLV